MQKFHLDDGEDEASLMARLARRLQQPTNIFKTPEEIDEIATQYSESVQPPALTVSKLGGLGKEAINLSSGELANIIAQKQAGQFGKVKAASDFMKSYVPGSVTEVASKLKAKQQALQDLLNYKK